MADKPTAAERLAQLKKEREAKTSGSGTSTANSYNPIEPYGTDPTVLEFLKKSKVKNSGDLYNKKIGSQKKSSKGYGEDIELDEWKKNNPNFIKQFESTGISFDPNNTEHMKAFEKFNYDFNYNKVHDKLISQGYDEATAKAQAKRVTDNISFNNDPKSVGYADQKWGNFHRSRRELEFEEPETTVATTTPEEEKKKEEEVTTSPPKKDTPLRNYKTPRPEFWLQDKINMAGAWGDMQRIKKYPPWMATAGFTLPEGMYYSPERELAANSEMINQGIQGASTFTGPQGYAATAGYLHGQGAKTAADIMGRYNNLNVTEANRLSDSTNAVLNYASQQRASNATQLYDKNTIMNQQFDNSKALARQKLRQGYMDALTNRANTFNLNTINPQFAVSPGNAGMIYNIPGSDRELSNQYKGQETPEEYMNRIRKLQGLSTDDVKFLYDNYPGSTKAAASTKTPSDATYEAMQRGYMQRPQVQQTDDETDETA
jgi:hypothetical protein